MGWWIINVEKREATSKWFLNFSYCHISSDFEQNLLYLIALCQSKFFWTLFSAPLIIFRLVQYVKEFLVCHKRFGPVQNILESVEEWGISIGPNLFWAYPKNWGIIQTKQVPKNNVKHVLRCITSVLISATASTALPQRIADEILDWSVSCKRSSHTSLLLSLAQCSKTVMTPLKNIQQTRAIEWYLFMKL